MNSDKPIIPQAEYREDIDCALSYFPAIEEIGRRVKSGEESIPTTGYFAHD